MHGDRDEYYCGKTSSSCIFQKEVSHPPGYTLYPVDVTAIGDDRTSLCTQLVCEIVL